MLRESAATISSSWNQDWVTVMVHQPTHACPLSKDSPLCWVLTCQP
ncbi:hypothetical protein BN978_02541 [Mycolicibacterium mageritense DSM 44476 = CIP 104973]|nr:hypothetical protein BN978_02541 [Mycolicibacterium mageritense DSM 44476 = CIP 104973]